MISTVKSRANVVLFTLSCLQEGVRLGRRQAVAQRRQQHSINANLAAVWRD